MHVDAAIRSRKSVRRFQPWPVPRATLEQLLELAARAPSGSNTQPWQVHVITGERKQALCADILSHVASAHAPDAEYAYYPEHWFEPYQQRRREVGFELYETLGIERHDKVARRQQELRNFSFFDAPVGLLISLDRRLGAGSFLDLGMFLQTFMLAARARGLHTCAQAAFAGYHQVVRAHVQLPAEQLLVCGIALGHEVHDAAENTMKTPREAIEGFTSFHGFAD
ncbi:nitroreductase [Pseudomonas sp. H9]|uniref:nitroreductase n=1 Tax=Pseudomonas sp. H9 TaxID=483968 RepID=UPI0010576A6D|nr:nitroreductase [Pseudomonas sp. H9]TDF80740.1 nitroreductase [Pseudomonas sp. H9]